MREDQNTSHTPHYLQILVKALLWQLAVWCLTALLLFLPAGTFAWPQGWIFFVTFFGFVGGLSIFLLRQNAQLLDERMTFLRRDQPFWDRAWIVAFYLLSAFWLTLMPLDAVRWQWSQMLDVLQIVGALLLLCSCAGIFLTIRENSYLSPVVRLQRELVNGANVEHFLARRVRFWREG